MNIFNWHELITNASTLLNTAYILTVVFIILLILLENRSPLKSISWILVITLIPIAGILLYFFFGQKYRKKRIYSKKEARYQRKINEISEYQIKALSQVKLKEIDEKLVEKSDIMTLLLRNDKAFLSRNKSIQVLKNGSETFEVLKNELRKAKKHIHFEFYIFKFDGIGLEIFEILKEKSLAGVEVRVIYDSVGSYKMPSIKKREAKNAGIQLKSFQRVIFPILSSRVNYRNHRKIVVIDGKIGFTGGLNVADRYLENKPNGKYWRDTFVKIEGKAASALQSIFINDWFYVSKESIYHEKYFTEEDGDGNITQIISSGPDSNWHAISQFYFSAITSSKKNVYIASPYFIPNDEISFALKAAALRGIDVRILIPKKSDTFVSHLSSTSYIKEMLKAGVKIYRYEKGFCHSKILMSDGVLSSIGSANLDYRSLETNFEVNAIFYDEKVTAELTKQYLNDLNDSEHLQLGEWRKRAWYLKLISSVARLFAPLM